MIDVGAPIRQGAGPHGHLILGNGPRTFSRAGCLICCLTMCARALKKNTTIDVLDVHREAKKANAFLGSSLLLGRAAESLGVKLEQRSVFDLQDLTLSIRAGQPVVVGVDYRAGKSSGFSDADHFVVVVDVDPVGPLLMYADPATGLIGSSLVERPRYRDGPCIFSEMIRFTA